MSFGHWLQDTPATAALNYHRSVITGAAETTCLFACQTVSARVTLTFRCPRERLGKRYIIGSHSWPVSQWFRWRWCAGVLLARVAKRVLPLLAAARFAHCAPAFACSCAECRVRIVIFYRLFSPTSGCASTPCARFLWRSSRSRITTRPRADGQAA